MRDRASVRLKIFLRFLDIAKNLSRITFPVKEISLGKLGSFRITVVCDVNLARRIVFELSVGRALMGF